MKIYLSNEKLETKIHFHTIAWSSHICKKRLALICQHFHPEMLSTGIFMTQIATGLSNRGWAIRVYCRQPVYRDAVQDQDDVPKCEEYEGVEIIRIPSWGNP